MRCNAGRFNHARLPFRQVRRWRWFLTAAECLGLWLDESGRELCLALHPSRRHRYAAYADLPSDKGRLGVK